MGPFRSLQDAGMSATKPPSLKQDNDWLRFISTTPQRPSRFGWPSLSAFVDWSPVVCAALVSVAFVALGWLFSESAREQDRPAGGVDEIVLQGPPTDQVAQDVIEQYLQALSN